MIAIGANIIKVGTIARREGDLLQRVIGGMRARRAGLAAHVRRFATKQAFAFYKKRA